MKLPRGKLQVIDLNKLKQLIATIDKASGHVSIAPRSASELESWMESRGTSEAHPLTTELQSAVIDTINTRARAE